jgi:hypothetical protein
VFTSPTTVDVEKDTNASEIIYTATTKDDTWVTLWGCIEAYDSILG